MVGTGHLLKRDHAGLCLMGKAKHDHKPQPRLAFLEVFACRVNRVIVFSDRVIMNL